jgi:hypothetical protein
MQDGLLALQTVVLDLLNMYAVVQECGDTPSTTTHPTTRKHWAGSQHAAAELVCYSEKDHVCRVYRNFSGTTKF